VSVWEVYVRFMLTAMRMILRLMVITDGDNEAVVCIQTLHVVFRHVLQPMLLTRNLYV